MAERYKNELTYVKDSYQKLNYQLLEKDDNISKLELEINTIKIRQNEKL